MTRVCSPCLELQAEVVLGPTLASLKDAGKSLKKAGYEKVKTVTYCRDKETFYVDVYVSLVALTVKNSPRVVLLTD